MDHDPNCPGRNFGRLARVFADQNPVQRRYLPSQLYHRRTPGRCRIGSGIRHGRDPRRSVYPGMAGCKRGREAPSHRGLRSPRAIGRYTPYAVRNPPRSAGSRLRQSLPPQEVKRNGGSPGWGRSSQPGRGVVEPVSVRYQNPCHPRKHFSNGLRLGSRARGTKPLQLARYRRLPPRCDHRTRKNCS